MRKIIGRGMTTIGSVLWQNGGWTGDERYEDLKVMGKFGYRMFVKGMDMMGITPDDLESLAQ